MRIISRKKDYYDSVQSLGQDKDLIYIRKPKELRLNEIYWKSLNDLRLKNRWLEKRSESLKTVIIGFCGKIYFYASVDIMSQRYYIKSIDEFEKILIKHKRQDLLNRLRRKGSKYSFYRKPLLQAMEELFKLSGSDQYLDFFIDLNVPIFILTEDDTVIFNPDNLKDYDFYHIFDAYCAYQELEMFHSNILKTNQKEMVNIEDKYKIEQHGFDKWSFRKQSNKGML